MYVCSCHPEVQMKSTSESCQTDGHDKREVVAKERSERLHGPQCRRQPSPLWKPAKRCEAPAFLSWGLQCSSSPKQWPGQTIVLPKWNITSTMSKWQSLSSDGPENNKGQGML